MDEFDGELYLRRLGEKMLLSRQPGDLFRGTLIEQARTLATVGATPPSVAQRVVDEYARAAELRGRGPRFPSQADESPAQEPPPHRFVACRRTIEQASGRVEVRYAILSTTQTRLAVKLTRTKARQGERKLSHHAPFHGREPIDVLVTDERGTTGVGSFSGGGSGRKWKGHYNIDPPLDPDTSWIEVFGERIQLHASVDAREVRVETFSAVNGIERCLMQCVVGPGDHFYEPSLPDVVAALTAAGLVSESDPRVIEARAVRDTLQHRRTTLPITPAMKPFHAFVARGHRTDGPSGTILVGGITPVFDRVYAVILELDSSRGGFTCEFEVHGPAAIGPRDITNIGRVRLSYSAIDDRGNFYHGRPDECGGGNSEISGVLKFWPALDPAASRLDLALTTDRASATVTVPLEWKIES